MSNLLDSIINYIGNRGIFKDGDGNVEIDGNLTVGGHSSNIGDDIIYTATSATSTGTSVTNLGYIDVPEGTWLIRAYVTFAGTTGADGYRRAYIGTSSTDTSSQTFGADLRYVEGNTIMTCTPYRLISTTETSTRYYLKATAAGTVNISARNMRAYRLL